MKRAIRRLSIGSSLLMSLVLVLWVLLNTSSGIQLIIALSSSSLPGTLTVTGIRGRIIGPVHLSSIEYQSSGLSIKLTDLALSWRPMQLRNHRLHLSQIDVGRVEVMMSDASVAPDPDPVAPGNFELPFALTVGRLNIAEVILATSQSTYPALSNVELTGECTVNECSISRFSIQTDEAQGVLSGDIAFSDNPSINVKYDYTVNDETSDFNYIGSGAINGTATKTIARLRASRPDRHTDVSVTMHLLENNLVFDSLLIDDSRFGQVAGRGSLDIADLIIDSDWQWHNLNLTDPESTRSVFSQGMINIAGPAANLRLQLDSIVSVDATEYPLSANAEFHDNTLHIKEILITSAEAVGRISGTGEYFLSSDELMMNFNWQDIAIPVDADRSFIARSGSMQMTGSTNRLRLLSTGTIHGPIVNDLNYLLEIEHAADQQTVLNGSFEQAGNGGDGKFTIDYRWPSGQFESRISLNQVQVSNSETTQTIWLSGDTRMTGEIDDYIVDLTGVVDTGGGISTDFDIQGSGNRHQFRGQQATLHLLDGVLDGRFNLDMTSGLVWETEFVARELNPSTVFPVRGSHLGFNLKSIGQWDGEGFSSSISVDQLVGKLDEGTVEGRLALTLSNSDVQITALDLQWGNAALSASGSIADRMEFNWELSIPDLAQVISGSRGVVNSSGHIYGTVKDVRADFVLNAGNFDYSNLSLDGLTVIGSYANDKAGSQSLNVSVDQANIPNLSLREFQLIATGNLQHHRIQVSSAGDIDINVDLAGRWDSEAWHADLENLTLQHPLIGHWVLEEDSLIDATGAAITFAPFCMHSDGARFCSGANWSELSGWVGQSELSNFNVTSLLSPFSSDLTIDSPVSAALDVQRNGSGELFAMMTILIPEGELSYRHQGDTIKVSMPGGSITSAADGDSGEIHAEINLGEIGYIRGNIHVRDISGNPILDGNLSARYDDPGLIAVLFPDVSSTAGLLTVESELSGSLSDPQIYAAMELKNGTATIPSEGIVLSNINANLTSERTGGITLKGTCESADGTLQFEGALNRLAFDTPMELSVTGNNFLLSNTADLKLRVSPDLKLNKQGSKVRLTGAVAIPELTIQPASYASTARTSPDVKVIGEDENTQSYESYTTEADLDLSLGESVHVYLPGFQSRLQGDLRIVQLPDLTPIGHGTLNVIDGSYELYGQRLDIESGRLSFNGNSLDNPALDLKVVRKIGAITAGALVQGRLKSPQIKLFSTPKMPDTDIASYMMLGRSADSRSTNDMMVLLRTALSLSGTPPLEQELMRSLSLDTLDISSNPDGSTTSLVLGKYLTPEIYVSYGVGLFEAVNSFLVRYAIRPGLALESRTNSIRSSADLIYTFSRRRTPDRSEQPAHSD